MNIDFEQYREPMIETLKQLVAIPSIAQDNGPEDAPCGKEVDRAYQFMLDLAKDAGFTVTDADRHGGHFEFGGWKYDEEGDPIERSDEALGILGHLDVVPEGSDWKHEPFNAQIEDGKIYGRGTADDKGPTVAAFYAMKALKDAGFKPSKRVRMIVGLDEETNWDGMEYYLSKFKAPEVCFVPDANFPLVQVEMGILVFDLAKKFHPTTAKGLELRSINGGTAPNCVPDAAKALLHDETPGAYDKIREKLEAFKARTSYTIKAIGRGKSLEISTEGISAHGASPQKGLNAVSILMAFLGELNFANDDVAEFIRFYNESIGFETKGKSLGIYSRDEVSGDIIVNMGMIQADSEVGRVVINVRYPATSNSDAVYGALQAKIDEFDLGLVKHKEQFPINAGPDSPLFKCLLAAYQENTGDYETKPIITGGGTYARAVPCGVAFGPGMPGKPCVEHQRDEYIEIEDMMTAMKIYADAIERLAR